MLSLVMENRRGFIKYIELPEVDMVFFCVVSSASNIRFVKRRVGLFILLYSPLYFNLLYKKKIV